MSILSDWKIELLQKIKKEKPGACIEYILPPKTGTVSVCRMLQDLKGNKLDGGKLINISHCHNRRANEHHISFMTIRHPVSRMNSFMAWKRKHGVGLTRSTLRNARATRQLLSGLPLNRVVRSMTDKQLQFVVPDEHKDCMQHKFAKHVDICLTIQEVPEALKILLDLDFLPILPHGNKTKKLNKELYGKQLKRVENLYEKDLNLYKLWTRKDN